ncbi:MFS transporter [Demequina sp.]|uniref:MFS transporter n=1 Tax=Demequina sp. TaxID=2050685 RepID=UPI003A88AF3E
MPAATREERLILWIAIIASFVAFLDGTVVNVALPAIVDDLGGGLTTQQWTVDAYLLTLGAFILVAGSISDSFGRIRVLRWGLVGFAVTSLLIAAAPTAPILIVARLLQGIAGALLVPSSLALITSTFRGAAQARAIGTWTGITSAAMVVGPLIGGLLVDLATWRLAFFINVVPIGAALWLLTRLSTRDVRTPDARVDFVGAALCVVGLGGIVLALIEQPNLGWTSPLVWACGLVGAIAFAAFVWRQTRTAAPMLPLSLFSVRNFAWGNLATWLIYGALSLNGFAIAVYLQEHAGVTATAAGLATVPVTIILMLGSSAVGTWAGRLGPRLFMTLGPLTMALGAALMMLVQAEFNYWWQLLPGVMVFGVGLTLTVSPLTSAILGSIEPARAGVASATNNAVSRVAGLIAIAGIAAIVGGELDLAGFHRAMAATALAMAAGGLVSWIGIRNAPATTADAHSPV